MNISVPSTGSYRVWVRMLAPSTNVNGFYIQIPDGSLCNVTMADAVIPTNTWTWVDYRDGTISSKVNVALSSGTHQVILAGLDDGVQIDKILLLSDTACTPTGDGANCTTAAASSTPTPSSTPGGSSPTPSASPTPVTFPSGNTPSGPITVSGTITIPKPDGLTNVQCKIDDKPVDCNLVDTTKLSDGRHTVVVTGIDSSGKTVERKTTINVKNKQTPWEQLVAGARKYWLPLAIAILLVIAAPVLWYTNRRFGLLARLRPGLHPATPSTPSSSMPTSTPQPAPSSLIYPDHPKQPGDKY